MTMKVKGLDLKIIRGDITELSVDAIVNPANTALTMNAGLAHAIKTRGGDMLEKVAMAKGPLAVGNAIWTEGGSLKARYIIHAAIMSGHAQVQESDIRRACASALQCALELRLQSLAFPAVGCGKGGFSVVGSAKILAQEILKLARQKDSSLKKITICLLDETIYKTFQDTIRGYIDHIQDTLGLGPYVTVDVIIEQTDGIILIERSNPPYGWALPGGFVDCGESLEQAVIRETKEETGLSLEGLRQFHTYSDPDRDPRFHTVSTVFIGQGKGIPKAGDDAKNLKVIKFGDLLKGIYAFDHKNVIADYLAQRKRNA
jgi:8-oxo-dGTP diphosphatase